MYLKSCAITIIASIAFGTAFAATSEYQFNYPAKLYQPLPESQPANAKNSKPGQLTQKPDNSQSKQTDIAQKNDKKNTDQKPEEHFGEFITIVGERKPTPKLDPNQTAQANIPTVTKIPPNSMAIDARMGGEPQTAVIDSGGNLKIVTKPAPTPQRPVTIQAPVIPQADVRPGQAQRFISDPNASPFGENQPTTGVAPTPTGNTPASSTPVTPEQAAAAKAQAAAQAADADLESPIAPASPPSPVAPVSPDAAPAKDSPVAKTSPETKISPTAKISPDAPEIVASPAVTPAPPIKPGYLTPPDAATVPTTTTTTTTVSP